MLILALGFGGFLTLCYMTAVIVLGTNGVLFTAMTNALVLILMLALGIIDKEKLKKLLGTLTGNEDGEESSDDREPEGPGE